LALIPEDKIAEIRDRTDIVQVIGEYVSLKRSGVNHKGLCPFHQEKSPSFNVNAQKQFFHCFGCGKSGDVFSFLTEVDGKSFVEVARELARKAGVDLPEPPRSREAEERSRAAESERARMVRLNELVATWFTAQLQAPAGEKARAYVEKRGIAQKTQEAFRVGYAPAGWEALSRYLETKKVPVDLAERAGLIRRREGRDSHFDVFVDRVVYALTSPMGEVIGFGGRVMDPEQQPKYKNSPETLIYKKGENLFGLHAAKHAIRRGGRALVVEGNFDVMTLHDKGIDYAVAPQGTAITAAQVALLGRFAKEVLLMLDADPAGRAATLKVVQLFAEAELKCGIVSLRSQNGKKVDPDDLARNDLPKLQAMLDAPQDAVEFFFDQVASTAAPTVPGRVQAIEECVPLLRAIREPLARDLYVDRLAQILKVEVGLIRRAMRSGPQPQNLRPVGNADANARQDPSTGEASGASRGASEASGGLPQVPPRMPRKIDPGYGKLLAFLGQHGTLIARMSIEAVSAIADPQVRSLVESAQSRGRFDVHLALEEVAPEIKSAVGAVLSSDEFATDDEKVKQRLLDEILHKLSAPKARLQQMYKEHSLAVASGDHARVKDLQERISAMTGEQSR
jgi:DNA primase